MAAICLGLNVLTYWGLVAHMCQRTGSALVQVMMTCCLFGANPLPQPMLTSCQLDPWEQISVKSELNFFLSKWISVWKYHLHDIWVMPGSLFKPLCVNTLKPWQNGLHFPDDIFMNKNVKISINISLKFVPRGPIDNIPALVQMMAWRRPGNKPLSEPMMVSSTTHICVTRPQWVNRAHNYGSHKSTAGNTALLPYL